MQNSNWPLPKFHFQVKWDDVELAFQEISGLNAQPDVVEYRAGNSKAFSPIKLPGLRQHTNIVMKKGVFTKDNAIFDWFLEFRMNTITRKSVTISLLDEAQAPTMVWRVQNAYPVKIVSTDLKAEGNEVAVETVELAHEGIVLENG